MKYLYLCLDIGSFLIPFLFSFHPKLQFYKKWKSFFIANAIVMGFFIPWDIIFTSKGFWGFNESYISGLYLFKLPIEEWLFFICIPYACMFTHYSLLHFFPKVSISKKASHLFYVILQCVLIAVLLYFYDRWYTAVSFSFAILTLAIAFNFKRNLLDSFYFTFLVILIPFFIINGILTGSGLDNPIVWYNNTENINVRLFTIPVEDIIYAFGMLLSTLIIMDYLEKKKKIENIVV